MVERPSSPAELLLRETCSFGFMLRSSMGDFLLEKLAASSPELDHLSGSNEDPERVATAAVRKYVSMGLWKVIKVNLRGKLRVEVVCMNAPSLIELVQRAALADGSESSDAFWALVGEPDSKDAQSSARMLDFNDVCVEAPLEDVGPMAPGSFSNNVSQLVKNREMNDFFRMPRTCPRRLGYLESSEVGKFETSLRGALRNEDDVSILNRARDFITETTVITRKNAVGKSLCRDVRARSAADGEWFLRELKRAAFSDSEAMKRVLNIEDVEYRGPKALDLFTEADFVTLRRNVEGWRGIYAQLSVKERMANEFVKIYVFLKHEESKRKALELVGNDGFSKLIKRMRRAGLGSEQHDSSELKPIADFSAGVPWDRLVADVASTFGVSKRIEVKNVDDSTSFLRIIERAETRRAAAVASKAPREVTTQAVVEALSREEALRGGRRTQQQQQQQQQCANAPPQQTGQPAFDVFVTTTPHSATTLCRHAPAMAASLKKRIRAVKRSAPSISTRDLAARCLVGPIFCPIDFDEALAALDLPASVELS